VAAVVSALRSVATEEGDLSSGDHRTLMVRDPADIVLGVGGNVLPTDGLVATLRELSDVRQVNAPKRGERTLLQVTATMDVHVFLAVIDPAPRAVVGTALRQLALNSNFDPIARILGFLLRVNMHLTNV